MALLTLLVAAALVIAAFELAVWLAAPDSTDTIDSPEWDNRRTWRCGAL